MQGGVGEAGRAVEDRASDPDHVEPLEERAGGKAIEDGLLVETAGVEVGIAKGGEYRGVLQALVAGDQLGFHGGVEIVLLDPLSYAFGEGIVVERIAEAADSAVDLEYFVDGPGVVGAFGTDEADVEGRELGVLEPGAEEVVAAANAEG